MSSESVVNFEATSLIISRFIPQYVTFQLEAHAKPVYVAWNYKNEGLRSVAVFEAREVQRMAQTQGMIHLKLHREFRLWLKSLQYG